MLQTLRLLIDDIDDGEYHLTITLQQPKGGPAAVRVREGAAVWSGGDAIDLGPVIVAR